MKTVGHQLWEPSNGRTELEIKQQIYEKTRRRMAEFARQKQAKALCHELNPDVIVISDDQSWLFEAQNSRASSWLNKRCGIAADDHDSRERIRVHPCESPKIIAELKAAGFEVNC